ncbi:MAG: acetoin utilization protein AcuC, partial [Actinobacteria bacterium]|nr:acetoin utilization protein AcuC [Actinomycetota bacterium]
FGSWHPLRPERVTLTIDSVRSLGVTDLGHVAEVPAGEARDDQVTAVHDPEFVAAVKAIDEGRLDAGEGVEFGLGTPDDPVFPNMHGAAKAVCGASVTAAELVASGDVLHAFNPAGGLHHARRREASGFCIYNDPAVAIAAALELQPDWRVMYVDVDVHHGDGVQWIFYEDPRVLTVSLHQSGSFLYPGTGFEDEIGSGAATGTSANIPLLPFTGAGDYLWALEEMLSRLGEAFRPHLLVTQLGADTHHGDPLANLGLTMPAYPRMASILHDTAHDFTGGRWVATGGGGYQAESIVPKVWTIHFAEMCEAQALIPDEFLDDISSEEVSKDYRISVQESVTTVIDTCSPRLSVLSGAARTSHDL